MRERAQLKEAAKQQLAGKWVDASVCVLVFSLILGMASCVGQILKFPLMSRVVALVVAGPLIYGVTKYFLDLSRNKVVEIKTLFAGFQEMFSPSLKLYLWMVLKIFLWSLLLFVPGIIKGYAYSQAFYLLNDNKKLGYKEALDQSEKMMDGHKGELFMLQLSFIGWTILAMIPCGLGLFVLAPYMSTTLANYYEDLKGKSSVKADKKSVQDMEKELGVA